MKYVCTICGYIYDEEQQGIPFEQLPDSWVCPVCGAPKALFERQESMQKKPVSAFAAGDKSAAADKNRGTVSDDDVLTRLDAGELSALFSNLASGCEKQYQEEARDCFKQLADYFKAAVPEEREADFKRLADLIRTDLDDNYKALRGAAESVSDRGALRIVVWGEKVTRMAKSLIDRYIREGDAFLENTGLYVCTVCGFLYLGNTPPELCPVCKVPGWKFKRIEGRVSK